MRTASCFLLVVLAAPPVTGVVAAERESYLKITVADRSELGRLTRLVSIDRVNGLEVHAYATPHQLETLAAAGYSWQSLPLPGAGEAVRMGLADRAKDGQWDAYPTYSEYVAIMERFAAERPDLCRLVDLGPTANLARPHRLLALKISDNPDLEEDEPEVLLTSTMHGDEVVGYVLMLRLVDELLTHYEPGSVNPYARQLTELVDGLELWVNPLANPDGTYAGGDDTLAGAWRYFANPDGSSSGVDPNRNFPDPVVGAHPDGHAYWPETEAMMALAAEHSFVLSANFHGGAEVVNYPWDSTPRRHVDDAWFSSLARTYADRAHEDAGAPPYYDSEYMRDLDNGVTNGYDWYSVHGGRQDFTTYWHGGRETTVELSHVKKPLASALPRYWEYNRRALLDYLGFALRGVRGTVRDGAGNPFAATVVLLRHDVEEDRSWVYTDPDLGDFHRLVLPGHYLVLAEAAGYRAAAAQVTVLPGPAARVELVLEPASWSTVTVHGRVRTAWLGQPVASAEVELLTAPGGLTTTGVDGSFLLQELPEGDCVLMVTAPGLAPGVAVQRLRAPETTLEVRLFHNTAAPPEATLPNPS